MTPSRLPSPAAMRRAFERTGVVESFAVNYEDLDGVLEELEEHRAEAHWAPMVAVMIGDPESPPELIEVVAGNTEDPTVLNAIAVQQKTPTRILERLVNHGSRSVVEHSTLNLILRRLPGMSDQELRDILDRHAGEDGVSLGVRHAIARSRDTPLAILRFLCGNEEIDFIREAAAEVLGGRSADE